ncbi:MAG: RNA methyltransferase [Eubacteriales bacterium]|nr:RNA methyltransferase [Eubacteriales bacterium]
MITSTANKQIKYVNALVKKAKFRREEDLFVAEGLRMCQEIPGEQLRALYISESFSKNPACRGIAEKASSVETVSDEVFRTFSDTQTPQGILALVRQQHYSLQQVTAAEDGEQPLLMILERLQDPGNLGTILRAGEGAGVTGILMDSATADIYSPKVIRSTMGSVLRMPFFYAEDLCGTLKILKKQGISLYAAHLDGTNSYDRETYLGASGFLIGNEGNGLSEEAAALADRLVRIPMKGKVESLNAAVAASVLMFEAARQRRNTGFT